MLTQRLAAWHDFREVEWHRILGAACLGIVAHHRLGARQNRDTLVAEAGKDVLRLLSGEVEVL